MDPSFYSPERDAGADEKQGSFYWPYPGGTECNVRISILKFCITCNQLSSVSGSQRFGRPYVLVITSTQFNTQ